MSTLIFIKIKEISVDWGRVLICELKMESFILCKNKILFRRLFSLRLKEDY